VSVVDLAGRVSIGSSVLGNTLRDIADKGHKKILVNLGQVSYLDSSAIGELVSGYTVVAKQGGQLKLFGATKRIRNLLLITGQNSIFDMHDDEAAAINSFA
jgi:anti-sigma B factor antagonist